MTLPAHLCRVLSCGEDLNREQFGAHLEELTSDALPWFLLDQAARENLVVALFDAADSIELTALELSDAVQSTHYMEVGGLSGDRRYLLTVPADTFEATFPTAALVALSKAWPKVPDLFDEDGEMQLANKYRERLLLFSLGNASRWDKANLAQFLAALLGCRLKTVGTLPSKPHWTRFTRIEIAADGIAAETALMAGRLLQEVLSESRIRWRYVALYRVFEAAYLIGLKESLLENFLNSPKAALNVAQEALESELLTFKKLVEDKRLAAGFERFRAIVDNDSTNRFLQAIKRSLKGSKSSSHSKGVEYAYKIRCAIVHAGQHDVVFDRFQDGELGVELVLQTMEEAVFELLGLRA